MFRACELKDQTYKKTRTLHFSDQGGGGRADFIFMGAGIFLCL